MKIAAFNVKKLGWTKINKPVVRSNLIKIVSRYSVVVLLEVVDNSGKAMDRLLKELNQSEGNKNHPYAMKCSDPLGRSSYKEKFVFFYRENEVKMTGSYQYEEDEDALAREPFILRFRCPNTVVQRLVLIPVHTKPEDAERELYALHDVVEAVRDKWRTYKNIIILGDFNADGRYLDEETKEKIPICSAPYYWLIGDDVDTTSSNCNDHTYDRIVVFGEEMCDAVVPGSAKAFNFQKAYRLSDATTQEISDHYPVELELKEN